MELNQEDLQKRTNELADALREKTRKHNQMQELYNKLKRRALYSQVPTAVSDSTDSALRSNIGTRYQNYDERPDPQPRESFHSPLDVQMLHGNPQFLGEHATLRPGQLHSVGNSDNNFIASTAPRSIARPVIERTGAVEGLPRMLSPSEPTSRTSDQPG